jgi:hypothetical protein
MTRYLIPALFLASLLLAAPLSARSETGLALILSGNTYGEHSPCPS